LRRQWEGEGPPLQTQLYSLQHGIQIAHQFLIAKADDAVALGFQPCEFCGRLVRVVGAFRSGTGRLAFLEPILQNIDVHGEIAPFAGTALMNDACYRVIGIK
jgi:hypothetical protein